MKRDIGVYLEDILESIKRIDEYTQKITEEDFYKNVPIQDAVVRRFEIIGEATKHIPQSLKSKYPDIPWKKITGTRDIFIHEYFGVKLERVWKTIKEDLIPFQEQIRTILQEIDSKAHS